MPAGYQSIIIFQALLHLSPRDGVCLSGTPHPVFSSPTSNKANCKTAYRQQIVDKRLTLSLLRAARSETLSQGGGNRAVQRTPRLAWNELVELYDGEATLKERIDSLRGANLDGSDALIELADKYLGGYRDRLTKSKI